MISLEEEMINYFLITITVLAAFTIMPSFGLSQDIAENMFNEATEHMMNKQYREAIIIYDEILKEFPNNISTLKMKGIAQSNLGHHEKSMEQFYKIIQNKPSDVIALTGLGVGFGNFGEYNEAKKYFEIALEQKPNSIVIKNYLDYANKVLEKYPYTPTEKPDSLVNLGTIKIPTHVKPIAKWWAEGLIDDSEFVNALKFLIEQRIIQIQTSEPRTTYSEKIPDWVRNTAKRWSENQIPDKDFVAGLQYLMEKGIILVKIEKSPEEIEEEKANELSVFKTYLNRISNNVVKEKRYIEHPNPSGDVIKKFLRDYVKWNFEEEAKNASENFPDPTFEKANGVLKINYKVYVNEQPSGLPLDHVSTLKNSFEFWESQELTANEQKAKVDFEITNQKSEANVWVTWVVRDLGEGVLGHAHLGKGIVEVTLGDYNCDGSFQLYNVQSVEKIMTHELGHSIGLPHIDDPNNIMFPSMKPSYAYCLLG